MTKQEKFLCGIQTLVLLDANNRALDPDALHRRAELSPAGRIVELQSALEASAWIPEEVSVQDAIHSFYYWRCHQGKIRRPAGTACVGAPRRVELTMADEIDRNVIVLAVARLIWKHEISIDDLYNVLGIDLDHDRIDTADVIAELSGIMTGWKTKPEDE